MMNLLVVLELWTFFRTKNIDYKSNTFNQSMSISISIDANITKIEQYSKCPFSYSPIRPSPARRKDVPWKRRTQKWIPQPDRKLLPAAVRKRRAKANSFLYVLLPFLTWVGFFASPSCFFRLCSSNSMLSEALRWSSAWLESFKFVAKDANKFASDDRPDFLVTTHSYELPIWSRPVSMALNLVTDMVFSKRRYGMVNGKDLEEGRTLRKDMHMGA